MKLECNECGGIGAVGCTDGEPSFIRIACIGCGRSVVDPLFRLAVVYWNARYWIDIDGRIWRGPVAPDETLHYCTFDGFVTVRPHSKIWTLRRSSAPEDAIVIKQRDAEKLMFSKAK